MRGHEGRFSGSSMLQRQHEPFDPSHINNPIILLAASEPTCQQLDRKWNDKRPELRDQAAVAYEAGGLLSAGVSRFRSRRKKTRKEVRFAWNEMEACPFARREDLDRDQ